VDIEAGFYPLSSKKRKNIFSAENMLIFLGGFGGLP
jgi:hypothetical protein